MASRNKGGSLWETIRTIIYAVVIALLFRSFIVEPFTIPSGSMLPTLKIGDYIIVSKYSYGYSRFSLPLSLPLFPGRILYSEPERGDVVVFRNPHNESEDWVKRLVGLPGDKVETRNGRLYINDKQVPRQNIGQIGVEKRDNQEHEWEVDPSTGEYLVYDTTHYREVLPGGKQHSILEVGGDDTGADNKAPQIVPPDHFFFMGDNRDQSSDSRFDLGSVHKNQLIGRAEFVIFSTNGKAAFWEFWKWPENIRWSRIFMEVE